MGRVFFRLISRDGADSDEVFESDKPEVILGRDPSVDVIVNSAGVSRRHARVIREGDSFSLEDLGSSNGTFLNGQKVQRRVALRPNDQIGLGNHAVLTFDAEGEAAVQAPIAVPQLDDDSPDTKAVPRAVRIDRAETVLGDDSYLPSGAELPPQLLVAIAGEEPVIYPLAKAIMTIGRAEDNDIVISSKIVSRHHAQLDRVGDTYQIIPSPEAGNPVLFEGRPLLEPRLLKHEDKFRIGSLDPGSMVTISFEAPAQMLAGQGLNNISFGETTQITIGRDLSSDVTLNAPTVSRFHAQVERVGHRYRVRDLGSSNGTFVNDQRIEGTVWVNPNDTIRVGSYRFVVGQDQLAQYDETSGLRVEAIGLNKWVRKDLNILQNISVVFQPREFVVVVGQSGGGKSTLVDSIAGYRPATHGKVLVNGIDVYRNFDAIRNNIGFVPQKDIIHTELTVFQALDFAAQLRMPRDTSKTERHQRIMEVLEDLDLEHREDVQISGLSGGQLKRVSIGVELLTKPGLFFLDEPTSGLDPGTETALMQLMRRLADQGRTIVLITHATKNVMLADKVIFLARGGYMAWFGPPEEALKYFDQYRSDRERRAKDIEFDDIYAILDNSSYGNPTDWAERYLNHPVYERYVAQPLESRGNAPTEDGAQRQVAAKARKDNKQISSVRQFSILSARNFKILTRDRFSLALMLAAAPLIALLQVILALVMGREVMSFQSGHMPYVVLILFLLPVYGVMVGGLAQMREIVKESEIYRRERLINLKIFPYVLSKVWIAGLLALYQAAAYVIIQYIAFHMPGGALEFVLIYISMVLATMAGMMIGLFASALAPNANSAPLIVILLILPQIVLGGALIPLPQPISTPTSTRWGLQALMSATGIGSDVAADVCWQLPPDQRSLLTGEDKEENCRCMGTNMLNQQSCDFPGLGAFYSSAMDEPQPQAPPALPDKPEEPTLPDRPEEPADQSNQVAMADYLNALKAWEANVNQIQSDYKSKLDVYQSQAQVYQAQQVQYQTDLANWQISRAGAVEPAENIVNRFQRDFGYMFVDKRDTLAFALQMAISWLAQVFIISILFVAILILMKRKDVI